VLRGPLCGARLCLSGVLRGPLNKSLCGARLCLSLSMPLTLNVAVVLSPFFVERHTSTAGAPFYSGLAIDVFQSALDTVCKLFNSSYCAASFNFTEYTAYGAPDPATGAWSGAIGALASGAADIAVSDINENLARSRVVAFTGSWLDAPLAFLMSPGAPDEPPPDLWAWLLPFSPPVWYALLGMTCLFAVSLAWLERLSPFSFRNLPPVRGREEQRQRVNMKDTWHRAVNSLLGQGPWGIDLSSHSARVIWWAMAFLSLFTTTFYTSSLTSILSRAQPPPPIASLADLQRDQIPFCVAADSAAQAFILSPAAPAAIRVMAAYMTSAPSLEQCMAALLDANDPVRVVLAEAPILALLASSAAYCGRTAVVGTLVAQGYYSFPLRQGHPLAPHFADAILSMMGSLETNGLVTAALGGSGCSGRGGGSGSDGDTPRIALTSMGGVFLATLVLVLLAWALLAAECLVWRARGSSSKGMRILYKFCGGHDYIQAYRREDAAAEAAYVVDGKPAAAEDSEVELPRRGSEEVVRSTLNPMR
jgi:ABC-type amino acid transport substrate-binding protein